MRIKWDIGGKFLEQCLAYSKGSINGIHYYIIIIIIIAINITIIIVIVFTITLMVSITSTYYQPQSLHESK